MQTLHTYAQLAKPDTQNVARLYMWRLRIACATLQYMSKYDGESEYLLMKHAVYSNYAMLRSLGYIESATSILRFYNVPTSSD